MALTAFDVQRLLKANGRYRGDIDGNLGGDASRAIRELLTQRTAEVVAGWREWSSIRQGYAAAQLILKHARFDPGKIDGLPGMLTQQAYADYLYTREKGRRPDYWRPDDNPLTPEQDDRPKTAAKDWGLQRDMERRYGPAGGPQCMRGKAKVPFRLKIAWDLSSTITTISCHEEVAQSMERVYAKIASAYDSDQITDLGIDLFGGCYNYRNKRGGATLSTHAYGLAVDTDPERNQLRWTKGRARLAKPDAEEFWRCWESEGWLSLGKARDFDWMHIQAVGL